MILDWKNCYSINVWTSLTKKNQILHKHDTFLSSLTSLRSISAANLIPRHHTITVPATLLSKCLYRLSVDSIIFFSLAIKKFPSTFTSIKNVIHFFNYNTWQSTSALHFFFNITTCSMTRFKVHSRKFPQYFTFS